MRTLHSLTGVDRRQATHRGRAGPLRAGLTVLTVAALTTVSACTTGSSQGGPAGSSPAVEGGSDTTATVLDPATLQKNAESVVQQTPKPLQADRLAQGLVPPTNRWFSSLALGPEALPVFAVPLSFTEQKTGFGFGVPKVVTSDRAIIGGAVSDVTVSVPGVQSTVVSAYDDLTVTLEQRGSDGKALGHTVLAQGSPAVTFTATDALDLGQNVSFAAGEPPTVTVAGRTYGLLLDRATASGTGISVEAGGTVTWFAVPDGGSASTMASTVAPVTAGRVAYAVGSGSATTTLTYSHEGGGRRRGHGDAAPEGGPRGRHDLRPRDLPERLRHPLGLPRRLAAVERAGAPGHHTAGPRQARRRRQVDADRPGPQGRGRDQGVPGRHVLRRQGALPVRAAVPAGHPARLEDVARRSRRSSSSSSTSGPTRRAVRSARRSASSTTRRARA